MRLRHLRTEVGIFLHSSPQCPCPLHYTIRQVMISFFYIVHLRFVLMKPFYNQIATWNYIDWIHSSYCFSGCFHITPTDEIYICRSFARITKNKIETKQTENKKEISDALPKVNIKKLLCIGF